MIIDKKIKIIVNSMDIGILSKEKYGNIRVGNIIDIDVCDLSYHSGRKIKVKCDICDKEKELTYGKYNKNIKNFNIYTCSSKCSNIKKQKTSILKFGVINASQSEEKKKKRSNTNLKKFGVVNPYQNEEIKQKLKEISIKKYGTDNIFGSDEFKKYIKNYNFEHYGVEFVSQVPNIYMKQQKSGFRLHLHEKTKLHYRGTYEKDFLDFCIDNNIQIKQGKRFKYIFNEKTHYYFSDFYIESKNLIIEVKSTWTYNKYLEKNNIKQNAVIDSGYNYMFIIDKNYEELKKCLNIE